MLDDLLGDSGERSADGGSAGGGWFCPLGDIFPFCWWWWCKIGLMFLSAELALFRPVSCLLPLPSWNLSGLGEVEIRWFLFDRLDAGEATGWLRDDTPWVGEGELVLWYWARADMECCGRKRLLLVVLLLGCVCDNGGVVGLGNLKLVKMACGVSCWPDPWFNTDYSTRKMLMKFNSLFIKKVFPSFYINNTYRFIPNFNNSVLRWTSALPPEHAVQWEGWRWSVVDGYRRMCFSAHGNTTRCHSWILDTQWSGRSRKLWWCRK